MELKTELRLELYEYLGTLLYYHEHTHDWMEKDNIIKKMNAIYLLLDIDKKNDTFVDFAKKILKGTEFLKS